ncbi:unnamed protein product, partial [Polarella glacialis]
ASPWGADRGRRNSATDDRNRESSRARESSRPPDDGRGRKGSLGLSGSSVPRWLGGGLSSSGSLDVSPTGLRVSPTGLGPGGPPAPGGRGAPEQKPFTGG